MADEVSVDADGFPSELSDRIDTFDEALTSMDSVLESLHSIPLSQLHEKLTSMDKARLDLVGAYAVNSLFWMYLNCNGENPKEHGVKVELDRVRRYMDRVKEVQEKITDKLNQPSLDKSVAKRFIRSALWQAAHDKAAGIDSTANKTAPQDAPSTPSSEDKVPKRKLEENPRPEDQSKKCEDQPKKKKKKKKTA